MFGHCSACLRCDTGKEHRSFLQVSNQSPKDLVLRTTLKPYRRRNEGCQRPHRVAPQCAWSKWSREKNLNTFRWATSVSHSSCRCLGALFGTVHVTPSTPLRGYGAQNLGGVRRTFSCQALSITVRACRSCRYWQESDLQMMSDSGGRMLLQSLLPVREVVHPKLGSHGYAGPSRFT